MFECKVCSQEPNSTQPSFAIWERACRCTRPQHDIPATPVGLRDRCRDDWINTCRCFSPILVRIGAAFEHNLLSPLLQSSGYKTEFQEEKIFSNVRLTYLSWEAIIKIWIKINLFPSAIQPNQANLFCNQLGKRISIR